MKGCLLVFIIYYTSVLFCHSIKHSVLKSKPPSIGRATTCKCYINIISSCFYRSLKLCLRCYIVLPSRIRNNYRSSYRGICTAKSNLYSLTHSCTTCCCVYDKCIYITRNFNNFDNKQLSLRKYYITSFYQFHHQVRYSSTNYPSSSSLHHPYTVVNIHYWKVLYPIL